MSEPRTGVERVNGVALAYRHWPEPRQSHRPSVVLLHGVLQTGAGMGHLAEHLAQDREVLVPDLRGRGDSEQPLNGYDAGTMADDVAGLIERLGVERPAVIGRQHGGLIAYHLAARRPKLLCGMVLGDVNPEVSEARAAELFAAVAALPQGFASQDDATRFYEETLGLPPDRARHDMPSDLEADDQGGYRWRHNLDVVARIARASLPRSNWDVLAQVSCPALVLRGQRGSIRTEVVDRMVQTMSNARAQTIYGASNDVFLGPGSEQTLAAIQLFLFGLDTEGA
jgi:pimeloyl-ACP methyl ester carboxylesterase